MIRENHLEKQKTEQTNCWATETDKAAKAGQTSLNTAEYQLSTSNERINKHEKISRAALSAVNFFKHFSTSLDYVKNIIAQHQQWIEAIQYTYKLESANFENHYIKLHFKSQSQKDEDFTLTYDHYNPRKPWGNNIAHGDLVVDTGMSSHYLEGIKDILEIYIESNHFEDLIKKDRQERANDCFDWPKISKQKDIEKVCNLLKDPVFLNLIQENKLRDIIDSYDAYKQSITARKTNIRLKNIIAKSCTFHKMPEPPGAFCKAKDTAGMGKKSGVYFGWRDSSCFYVGKSKHIENRLKSHQIISLDDDVSWLEMPNHETHTNELFYIWLLDPECNSQVKLAEKTDESEDTETTP